MRSPRYTASGAGHASPKRNEACLLPPIATTTTTRLDNLVSASVASPWRCAAPTLLHQHPPKSSRSTSSHNSIGSFGTPTRRSEEGRSKSKQSAKVNSSGRQNPVNAPATYYYNSSDLAKKVSSTRARRRSLPRTERGRPRPTARPAAPPPRIHPSEHYRTALWMRSRAAIAAPAAITTTITAVISARINQQGKQNTRLA